MADYRFQDAIKMRLLLDPLQHIGLFFNSEKWYPLLGIRANDPANVGSVR
jgi:hypothetical protein